jgi:uncharacterized membrane protein YdfJ with MMPL/SSD domain
MYGGPVSKSPSTAITTVAPAMITSSASLSEPGIRYGVAISTSLAVLVVMAAAVTLLPALLSFTRSS